MSFLGLTTADLDLVGPNSIYDWRLGITVLIRVISYRLIVLGKFHPDFPNDGYAWTDLDEYRDALKIHYEKMLKGVRCATRYAPTTRVSRALEPYPNRCADIHTGLSTAALGGTVTWDLFWLGQWYDATPLSGAFPETDEENRTDAKREVIRRMPLYEVKAMIDSLYLLINQRDGVLDLT